MIDNKKVSALIPTLNEEGNIKDTILNLPDFIDEVIIIDGYSKDKTAEIAKKLKAKVIFDKGKKGSALIQGAKEAKGDILLAIDADGSHKFSELRLFSEAINAGYDFAFGSRFILGGGTSDMTLTRRLGNKFFVILVNLIYDCHFTDLCYGYRAFSKDAFLKLKLKSVGFEIETEMSIRAIQEKCKIIEIPSFEGKRIKGEGKLKTFKDGFRIFKTILKETK